MKKKDQATLIEALHDFIVVYIVLERLGRSEPRAVKRRLKPSQLMTTLRAEIRETIYRNRKHARGALNFYVI